MENLNLIKPEKVQNIINKFCYTIGMIPTSYKMSLTYEEQIIAIGHYLETTVYPAINNNAEALSELQNLFLDLKDYVDNYFENLDVQEEINNKLDEMAEQGILQVIIEEYINLKSILYFDNINDMKNATNLVNGSFVKTKGFYNKNDGGSSNYLVRTVTNNDYIDEITIFALNDNSLVAELLVQSEYNILQFGCKNQENFDNSPLINNFLSKYNPKKIIIPKGNFIIDETIIIENFNNLIIENYGAIHAKSSNVYENPIFYLKNSNNILLNNLKVTSTLDKTEPAPANHVRVDYSGSNRIAIELEKVTNIEINNLECENMYSDIWSWNRIDNSDNENIKINGWLSKNASNPMYASKNAFLYIDNAKIIAKNNLGYGNHFLYLNKYIHDVYITNSNFYVGDNNLGHGIVLVNSALDNPLEIYNIFIDNISMEAPNLFVLGTKGNCNFKISNSNFKQKIRNDDKSNSSIIAYSNSLIDFDNCSFSNISDGLLVLTITGTENVKAYFKSCNFLNVNENANVNQIVSLSNCSNNEIIFTDCIINCGRLIYSGGTPSNNFILFKNSKIISNDASYLVSIRNNNDKCIILNCFATSINEALNIIYNGGTFEASGIELLSSFFYGYQRVGSSSESNASTKINSYLNNTLLQ